VLRTKDAYPQFHIIICTIFIFLSLFLAVLSTFLFLVFSDSFMFAICFLLPHYLTILLSLPLALELGRRLRCRGKRPGFCEFPFSPYLLRILLV